MLKRLAIALVAGCLLVLIAAWESGLSLPDAQICSKEANTDHENCSTHNVALVFVWEAGKFLDDHNGAITAFFTFVLGVSTILLWKVTAKSANVAERALIDLERPYVFISRLDMSRRDQVIPDPHFRIGLKNHGRTPAIMQSIEFRAHMRRGFRDDEPISAAINAEIFELRAMSNVIGAAEDYTGTVIRSDQIDNEDIDIARSGLYQTQVLVNVTYRDIFKVTHVEKFDYMWDRRERMFLRTEDVLAGDAADQARIDAEKASQLAGNPPNWIS